MLEVKLASLTADTQTISHKLADQQGKVTKLQGSATDNEMAKIKVEGKTQGFIFKI